MGADLGGGTRLGGWQSWAAADGKKVAEQAPATTGPSVLRMDCFEKGERTSSSTGGGQCHLETERDLPKPQPVMDSFLRTVCQRAPQQGVSMSSLLKVA